MSLSKKFVKKQLERVAPIARSVSLELMRKGQNHIGSIMSAGVRRRVRIDEISLGGMRCAFAVPDEPRRGGAVLYVHGGGYCCGDLAYAKGFASTLADKCGVRVFTFEYRLAPEFPFPAALNDAVVAYKGLLERGYFGNEIVLCGESAGGGLIYSLCLELGRLGLDAPAGIIAISPWSDLTASGESYTRNDGRDAAINIEQLEFFASKYTDDRKNPLVSPLFADLEGLPPSVIFAGGDEIMLDDAAALHQKLLGAGCESELFISPEMWHAYLMYALNENKEDFARISSFLERRLPVPRDKMWLKLDNAAKIYPAAKNRRWSNLFRLSANMADEVDTEILRTALGVTVRRFPSISVRLSYGAFWYYLVELNSPPEIRGEYGHPIENMKFADIRKCAFRVLVYGNRIAVEFFHAITDGTGGMIFFKSLLAEYAERKYGEKVPPTCGILDRRGEIEDGELEDSFLKYAGDVPMSRKEATAYHVKGKREEDGFVHALTFIADTDAIRALAKAQKVSVTAFLCAVLMKALMDVQNTEVKKRRRRKPIKVLVPVNLRNIFPSNTLRNFALYVTPEITPNLGDYSFEEICRTVHYQMGYELTANRMRARITTNVNDEKSLIVRVMPLFIKNIVMKGIFNAVGEKKSCLTMSNLGVVELPEELSRHIDRFDFTLNVPANTNNNCSMLSYGGKTYISFVRKIRESALELRFHEILRDMGVRLLVESN